MHPLCTSQYRSCTSEYRGAQLIGQAWFTGSNQINSGPFTLENTRAAFTDPAQTEYTEIYGGLDFIQLVIAIYENFLERAPDGPGLDYWVGELDSGRVNADQMINAVINAVQDPNATGVEAAKDLSTLTNKIAAAIYFTEKTKEYTFDGAVREAARADVTDDPSTVVASKASTDAYTGDTPTNLEPIVAVAPVYPRRAQTRFIEGYCTVEFTVTTLGDVADPFVIDCAPTGVFDSASVKAILKFKYPPQLTNISGVRRTFTYELIGI
jgi:TonB family protein